MRSAGWLLGATLLLGGCGKNSSATAASADAAPITYTYQIANVFPHDRGAFTEGLEFRQGVLFESTGLNGQSDLRKVDLSSGRVLQQAKLSGQYFGEGMTVLGGKIFQLTWKNEKGFVYGLDSFALEREFAYTGEGWGLTNDGHSLIMSDGSDRSASSIRQHSKSRARST